MSLLKVVLLTESDSLNPDVSLSYKYYGQKLWETIEKIIHELNYSCETVDLHKLDFQEYESVNKFLNADIVIMDLTNQDRCPAFVYHKGNRESVECMDDIVLIQSSGVENDDVIQDIKATCKIKYFIEYRYDEDKNLFYDVSTQSTTKSPVLLKKNLKTILIDAKNNARQGLFDRYLSRMETRKNEIHNNKTAESDYLWKEICDEILMEGNEEHATSKLIMQLMYAFRDLQDYESMIKLSERCEQNEKILKKIQTNTRISYLAAFARSRRNQNSDREKALEILESLCHTKKTESELSNDITGLCGRIYKDKYTESNCQDRYSLKKAVEWYQRGFAADPNIYAGINLLFFLAITSEDLKKDNEAKKIIIQLNALLGKKARSLNDLNDYWDVATYFELHAIQHDWLKACSAALHMYLLNPPIWYLKSTINNLKILHQATCIRDQQKSREQSPTTTVHENVYSFWIDFFTDAIDSNSSTAQEKELPAQVPVLLCDNYEKTDGTKVNNIYVEAHLQINFHTSSESGTLVIRILEQQRQLRLGDLVKTIELSSIRSIVNAKRDKRSIFLYAYENSETFSSVELQLYFSSAERRAAFNEKMSKYRIEPTSSPVKFDFHIEFVRNESGQRIALGQGAYGRVYLAQDNVTYKKFAVKEIPMRQPAYTEDLENEIKILSSLHHKNIVSYYGTAIDKKKKPSMFQITMEYVEGDSLSKHISKYKKFSEPSIINYTRQLLEGLQYLHENHIVHRDIKSANILLNSKGEIKITDFGTSKRLAGLHLCKEDSVGTLQYMCPDVISVPLLGYGPEVDIWSVGCTVIEMATGKRPFHTIQNIHLLAFKLGTEKQPPEIPSDLSDVAKDFLAKCFETKDKRPSAKDLLNHPFLKTKTSLTRETSGHDRTGSVIIRPDSPLSFPEGTSEDTDMRLEPTPHYATQISMDDRRRCILANTLRNEDNGEKLIDQWMELIEEKKETDILTTAKLFILLSGICDYLDPGNSSALEDALDKICNRTTIDIDSRIDLERSIYLFIKAANNVLSSSNTLPPHDLFALDNIIRRIAEHLVGLIRPDFLPAGNNLIPMTPNNDSQMSPSNSHNNNEEITHLHQQYSKLVEKNREKLNQLIKLESNNEINIIELINNQKNRSVIKSNDIFFPVESPLPTDDISRRSSTSSVSAEQINGIHLTPMAAVSKGVKRARDLYELEQEHERLLKEITDNRTKLNKVLRS